MSREQIQRPNVDRALSTLKDFQRDTVDYVFNRMYADSDPTRRFLLADEVGLGKTMVARGVIARAIDHLWETTGRIDVIYICSNTDIARQNIERLKVDASEFVLASRITLLPRQIEGLKKNRVNFVSFTPSTSFDLKSRSGVWTERALIYWLLKEAWNLSGTGPAEVLRGEVESSRFRQVLKETREEKIDDSLHDAFLREMQADADKAKIAGRESLRARFEALCDLMPRAGARIPADVSHERRKLVAEIREMLAATCLRALEPDLIILDEFQRFKHLLDQEHPSSQLARALFDYSDASSSARVLLLSATPYKMYTRALEVSDDDHFRDFLSTLAFLVHDEARAATCQSLLREYRRALLRVADDGGVSLAEVKARLEAELKRVIVRTERLAATPDRDGMLVQVPCAAARITASDALAYVGVQRIADLLDQANMIEYWKSAAFLLNFMEEYKIKKELQTSLADTEKGGRLERALADNRDSLLSWKAVESYAAIDPGNPRLRWLLEDTIEKGAWRLLWVPPSRPAYPLGGAFADPTLQKLTKRLVFSAWHVVPKVIAATLSYEAERRMVQAHEPSARNTPQERKNRTGLLRFAKSDGRLAGMPLLLLFYPSPTLAAMGDPFLQHQWKPDAPVTELLSEIEQGIDDALAPHRANAGSRGATDETWYWAAPVLLDLAAAPEKTRSWLSTPNLATVWAAEEVEDDDADDGASRWKEHVERLAEVTHKELRLGRPPADLSRTLALTALAAPGTASLRAMSRIAGGAKATHEPKLRTAAAQLAWGMRALFNQPEATALIRGVDAREPFWQCVLEYCRDGDLSSVLDEYVHVLRESLGLVGRNRFEAAGEIAKKARDALMLRTSVLGIDEIRVPRAGAGLTMKQHRMRARFAMRFGDQSGDDTELVRATAAAEPRRARSDQVRAAFNSPFWPFVLASTSVGQEGLDFHQYCHAVVHWNLPSNPVDLEQREGRVHRYKGHAVRKNVAAWYEGNGAAPANADDDDLWDVMFRRARAMRAETANDLEPFWVFHHDGGAKIERYVPALPMSRDLLQYESLQQALAVYRMVFGQPRQEDLLGFLMQRVPHDQLSAVLAHTQIDLSPPRSERTATPTSQDRIPEEWDAAHAQDRRDGDEKKDTRRKVFWPATGKDRQRARRSVEAVREAIEARLGDVALRHPVIELFAESMQTANAINPHVWSLTCWAGNGALLRLNVGLIAVLDLLDRDDFALQISVRGRRIDRSVRERMRGLGIQYWPRSFNSEPRAASINLREDHLGDWLPELRRAHLDLVSLLASRWQRTPYRSYYSEGAVEYVTQRK